MRNPTSLGVLSAFGALANAFVLGGLSIDAAKAVRFGYPVDWSLLIGALIALILTFIVGYNLFSIAFAGPGSKNDDSS